MGTMAYLVKSLFVTYVEVEHNFLKIWGQQDRTCVSYIEKRLWQMLPDFNSSSGPSPSSVRPGMFCFAKCADENYFRARIISEVQGSSVGVLFIDYGNKDYVDLCNIRIRNGSADSVSKIVPQAEDYILAGVIAPPGGWTKEMLECIRRDLCYSEVNYRLVCVLATQKLIQIFYNKDNYANTLFRKCYGREIEIGSQQGLILSFRAQNTNKPKVEHLNRVSVPTGMNNANFNYNLSQYDNLNRVEAVHGSGGVHELEQKIQQKLQNINTVLPKNVGQAQVQTNSVPVMDTANSGSQNEQSHIKPQKNTEFSQKKTFKESNSENEPLILNSVNSVVIKALANELKQHLLHDSSNTSETIQHGYFTQVLEVGQTCNVYVTYIDDGPWSFSVQLVSSEHELNQLMSDLPKCNLIPIKLPVVLGCPCIAKSKLDDNLYRGVVVNISHSAVKVFYVDFGNTEDLPISSLYELPVKFFKTKALSQKFALSGLQRIKSSDDIKRAFVEVVDNELLILQVTTLEGDNLPTCELYLKNENIKRILNKKVRQIREWKRLSLPKQGLYESVVVTWIESPQKFFVQLKKNETDLEKLKVELAQLGMKGEMFSPEELVPGALCICCYSADNEWYRAIITSSSQGSVTVFYVDYGNVETVSSNMLRKVDNCGLIRELCTQAVSCCLYGFENLETDEKTNSLLENLVIEKDLQIKVMRTESDRIIVQLLDNGTDVSVLLAQNKARPQPPPLLHGSNERNIEKVRNIPYVKSNYNEHREEISQGQKAMSFDPHDFSGRDKKAKSKSTRSSKFENRLDSKNNDFTPKVIINDKFDPTKKMRYNIGLPVKNDEADGKSKFKRERNSNKNWRTSGSPDNNVHSVVDPKTTEKNCYQDLKSSSNLEIRMKRAAKENELRGLKLDNSRQSKQQLELDDIAPSGSKFQRKSIVIGTNAEIIVTYFLNPNEIYVQLISPDDEFIKMMNDIQTYYANKLPLNGNIEKGDLVIAKYGGDGILYRATVIETMPLTVRYVDYGNEEVVVRKNLWPVDKKFMKLEAQCLKCRIQHLQPNGGNTWPPSDSDISEFFKAEKYFCTFLSVENDVFEVQLKNPDTGKDIRDELISSGYAAATIFNSGAIMDISLMLNGTFNIYISHIVDASEFYANVDLHVLNIIEENIKTCIENKMDTHSVDYKFLSEGEMILGDSGNGKWLRARIIKKKDAGVLAKSVDYGHSLNLTSEQIKRVPGCVEIYSPQAVQCCLYCKTEGKSDIGEEFLNNCLNKSFVATIHEVKNDRLKVTLYDFGGIKLKFLNDINDATPKIRPISCPPIINQAVTVMPVYVASAKEVYVCLASDNTHLEEFSMQIEAFYGKNDCKLDVIGDEMIGKVCAAKSIDLNSWYRGEILSVSENAATIFYIDYGNTELVPLENIKDLNSTFCEQYAFVKKVSLNINYKEENCEEVDAKVYDLLTDKECTGYFFQAEDVLFAELIVNNIPVTDQLLSESVKKVDSNMFINIIPNSSSAERFPYAFQIAEKNSADKKVFISHVSNPNEFWIQDSVVGELDAFQCNFQEICSNGSVQKDINVGDVVGALFTDDLWYRAKVIHRRENILLVQFVDYGNSLEIDIISSEVRELPPDILEIPFFATCCSLKGFWKEGTTARFEEIITEQQEPFTVVEYEGKGKVIDLLQNGNSITEQLIKEGFFIESAKSNDEDIVYISHINSPNDFYIQRECDKPLLDKILESLNNVDSYDDITEIEDCGLYCAMFPEDNAWYRGKIIGKNENGFEVHFIDYGNSSITRGLKELPPDLQTIPGLALNCCLAYGNSTDTWSESACNEFMSYLNEVGLKLEIILHGIRKSVVKLYTENGDDITEKLLQYCQPDDRTEVYISHVNSPSDFYVQKTHDEHFELLREQLKLGDAFEEMTEYEIGSKCVSKYRDVWYRGEIKKVLEDKCEVFYFDYGNTAVSNELKKLPEDLKNIGPLAKNCSLNISLTNIPESIKEEFIKLTQNGETVFRSRIIKPGERDVISLISNGAKLEDILLFNISRISEIYNISEGDENNKCGRNYTNITSDRVESTDAISSINTFDGSNLEGLPSRNETDEEKRVKCAIKTVENNEGFRSDDEKGIRSHGFIDGTDVFILDSELLQETLTDCSSLIDEKNIESDMTISSHISTIHDDSLNENMGKPDSEEENETGTFSSNQNISRTNTTYENPGLEKIARQTLPEASRDSRMMTDDDVCEYLLNAESVPKNENNSVYSRSTHERNRIVPGYFSRGETLEVEDVMIEKLPHSEKIVPGSIARGISMDQVSDTCKEPGTSGSECHSKSAPSTPAFLRKEIVYKKLDHSDRLVPRCVSSGNLLGYISPSEKVVHDDKILPANVNATSE